MSIAQITIEMAITNCCGYAALLDGAQSFQGGEVLCHLVGVVHRIVFVKNDLKEDLTEDLLATQGNDD